MSISIVQRHWEAIHEVCCKRTRNICIYTACHIYESVNALWSLETVRPTATTNNTVYERWTLVLFIISSCNDDALLPYLSSVIRRPSNTSLTPYINMILTWPHSLNPLNGLKFYFRSRIGLSSGLPLRVLAHTRRGSCEILRGKWILSITITLR